MSEALLVKALEDQKESKRLARIESYKKEKAKEEAQQGVTKAFEHSVDKLFPLVVELMEFKGYYQSAFKKREVTIFDTKPKDWKQHGYFPYYIKTRQDLEALRLTKLAITREEKEPLLFLSGVIDSIKKQVTENKELENKRLDDKASPPPVVEGGKPEPSGSCILFGLSGAILALVCLLK